MKTPLFLSLNRFVLMLCFAAVPLYAVHHVAENGNISVAVELDLDHYSYYQGGEELYQALSLRP